MYTQIGASWYEPDYSEFRANMEAVNKYIMDTPAKTAKAKQLKDEWIKWYDGLDYYDYYVTCSSLPCKHWDEARMRRDAFNKANATTSTELKQVLRVQETGFSTEEAAGEPRRRTSEGTYGETRKPPPSWMPSKTVLYAGAGLLIAGLYLHFVVIRPRLPPVRRAS